MKSFQASTQRRSFFTELTSGRKQPAGQCRILAYMSIATAIATLACSAPASAEAVGPTLASGILTVQGGTGNDTVAVNLELGDYISVTQNNVKTLFPAPSVVEVRMYGNAGDDTLVNNTSRRGVIKGGDGNDVLTGGSGDDFIEGGYGQDTIDGAHGNDILWGSGGSDQMSGGAGDDELFGHGGNDQLHGGDGRDSLNGGSGNDALFGDAGQDLIVSVGSGMDTITGGPQWDNYWVDVTDVVMDPSANEISLGYVHAIAAFRGFSTDGGVSTTAVGLEPLGEDLPDPVTLPGHATAVLTRFASHPLFAKGGPRKNDIFQGAVGDCYLMAELSALADSDPEFIRRSVAPLGDGTYAVRFIRNGVEDYVRVDADLWTQSNGSPLYARFGQEGSLWVPIIEKAFAIVARDTGAYAGIHIGGGVYRALLPYHPDPMTFTSPSYSAHAIADWDQRGRPTAIVNSNIDDLLLKASIEWYAKEYLKWIHEQLLAGKGLTAGSVSGLSNTTPLIPPGSPNNTFRRAAHIYMVDHIEFDANANPVALVLRNPYGPDVVLTDLVRIYFCTGYASILITD